MNGLKNGENNMLTKDKFLKIMPRVPTAKVDEYFKGISDAMIGGLIITVTRMAAFLAQLAHESCELKYMEEIADGSAYEGRKDLGNTQPGDGKRFKGRGPIQLTGRNNYRLCGTALGLDLENHPELAAQSAIGFKIAVWYWTSHKLNDLADACNFDGITKSINGGLNGKPQRDAYFLRALQILGSDTMV
jgi:predicted chitinase